MKRDELHAMLRAAHNAMDAAVNYVLSHPVMQVREKGDRDVVTDVDVTVEELVRRSLHEYTPNLGFLGEETGAVGDQALYWVLDPIDGTTNFSHGMPLNAVALGLVDGQQPILGVIALPFLGKRYWATDGGGAYRDDLPISVSSTARMSNALIALSDYGHGSSDSTRDLVSSVLDHQLTAAAQGVRRLGSAAVDLAWVADGSLDASITLGNRTWDTAAGVVLAREAGAIVVDSDGSPHNTRSRCAVAVAPGLHGIILPMLEIARNTSYWPSSARSTAQPEQATC